MTAMSLGAAFEHNVYRGMGCSDTTPVPVSAAAFNSLALCAGIGALTIVMMSATRIGHRQRSGRAHQVVSCWATVVAIVVTVVAGCLYGPRDQHGRDPIAGPAWAMSLIAALIIAVALRCSLSVWRARGTTARRGGPWVMTGFAVAAAAMVLAAIGYRWWLDPHALKKICWYG